MRVSCHMSPTRGNRNSNGSTGSSSSNSGTKEKSKSSRSKNNSGGSQNKSGSPLAATASNQANNPAPQATNVSAVQSQLQQPQPQMQQQQLPQPQQPPQQQQQAKVATMNPLKMNLNQHVGNSNQARPYGSDNINAVMGDQQNAAQQLVVPPLMQPPAEYSPFNNLFSNMAEQVLHSGHNPVKDEYEQDSPGSSSSRMNFASAVGLSSNAPGSPHDVGDQVHHLSQKVDASK